ncbi:EAL domain-containing protein [uncultured Methylophaga sp.]|uniref:EAL domain-containing protein n=1 Tax=uncultured Methylophaga sp. TaxID=285271 RepID=UPI002620B6D4|nr:EAL domain-containing protein [uncultured Methylophaga sp.]
MVQIQEILHHFSLDEASFNNRKDVIRLTDNDVELLRSIHAPLQQYEKKLIDGFYAHLMRFEFAKELLSDSEVLSRLQATQKVYFRKLTEGKYDLDYARDRIRVGVAHERVGLTTQWYIGSYAVYLELASTFIIEIFKSNPAQTQAAINALYKVALLDITLAFDAYMFANYQSIEQARQEVSEKYTEQLKLQKVIDRIQKSFILEESYDNTLEQLLTELIGFTESTFGFIGDVLNDQTGQPYLKLRALTNIAWNDETQALYESNKVDGLEFHNHHNLLGTVLTSGEAVISNTPYDDVRSGGIPSGHPTLNAFLGLPFFHDGKMIGMIGLANAEQGYDENTIKRVQPILDTLGTLSEARKIRDRLNEATAENNRLALVAKQTINGVIITDKDFRIQWCNDGFESMTGYTLEELYGIQPWSILAGPATNRESLDLLKAAMAKCESIEIEILKYHKNGYPFWSKVIANPTFDDAGTHSGFVSVELDVTESRTQQDSLQSFKSALDQILDAILFFDAETLSITYANHGAQKYLKRSESELLELKAHGLNSLFHHETFEEFISPLSDGSQSSINFITWYVTGDGQKIPSDVSMQMIELKDGHKIILTLLRDISEAIEVERLRQQNESRIETLLLRSIDAMGIINREMLITECNDAAVKLFGKDYRQDLIGLSPADISPAKQTKGLSTTLAKEYLDRAMTEGYQRFEWLHKTPYADNTPIEVTLTPVIFRGEACIQVVWRDLTDIKVKEHRIKQLAYFDELTGLANKNLFAERVKHLINLAKRYEYTIAVVYLDLANLDDINETLGSIAGDALIYAVGQRLSCIVRSADTLAHYVFNDDHKNLGINHNDVDREFDSLARVNGDILALAAVIVNVDAAQNMVSRLQEVLKTPFSISATTVSVSSKAGIALYPQDADDFEALTRGATIALDLAKQKSLPFYFFNPQIGEQIQQRSVMAKRLEYTLKFEPDHLSIRFQPQVNLETFKLSGAEILLRWNDSSLGNISPGAFIPLAEERGLINRLTKTVINLASSQVKRWKQAGHTQLEDLNVRMALNISAKSIDNQGVIDEFIAIINESGLTPSDFELELTETGIMHDPESAIKIIKNLKTAGFMLAIDDFGMGHSSLSYLRNIDADVLKIDMFYVRNMLNDDKNLAIVKTIISTAQIFGMKTLAEGVEDMETANKLRALGCNYAQGYIFSHPLTAEDFEQQWLT